LDISLVSKEQPRFIFLLGFIAFKALCQQNKQLLYQLVVDVQEHPNTNHIIVMGHAIANTPQYQLPYTNIQNKAIRQVRKLDKTTQQGSRMFV
jgi:hypothetical protein